MTETPRWFTSSYSQNGGACVEVAVNLVGAHGVVPVRDSKDRGGPVLSLAATAFSSFVAGVRDGEFGAG
ncbi:DUF397 domain-containing protein [Streptomyces sp. LP05-1]|uniref:DUF397 domain-containing protein n=1 Tax=Streptomyces pyxinae TaxID=2970734 RepID=A0ABT2CR04_9ACTN|nr:DUF397 domain-containing protein [Streptomyces sp. LP05-1]MCS0639875.1 DUF397 domain-containing protein [Streptomyces sp. LP05-1]